MLKTDKSYKAVQRKGGFLFSLRLMLVLVLSLAQVQFAVADIYNTATASGTYNGNTVTSAGSSVSVPVTLSTPTLRLLKTGTLNDANGDGAAQIGEVINYQFTVTNAGNVDLSSITLSDPNAVVNGGPIALLNPSQSDTTSFTAQHVITQSDLDAGKVTNSATASANTPNSGPISAVSDSQNPGDDTGANDDATVVILTRSTIVANADNFTAAPIAGVPGGATASVFTNDRLNNAAINSSQIVGSLVSNGGLTGLSLNGDGTLQIPPNSPSGTYTATYRICEVANINNCAQTTAQFVVQAGTIVAQDDNFTTTPIVQSTGGQTASVLTNDSLNGGPVILRQLGAEPRVAGQNAGSPLISTLVNVSIVATDGLTGVTIDTEGNLLVPPNTPPRTYAVTYQICEKLNPTNCASAIAQVLVKAQDAQVSGRLYYDKNGDGVYDAGDQQVGAGYIVDVIDSTGAVLQTAVTNADGTYSFSVPPGNGYKIVFKSPSGQTVGVINNISVTPGQNVTNLNEPIDPSGVVYNAVTYEPISGVKLTMVGRNNQALPVQCFVDAAQQNQVTDQTGAYRFDIVPNADAACPSTQTEYRILVVNPAGYRSGLAFSPLPGVLDPANCTIDTQPGGACEVSQSTVPATAQKPIQYYMAFLLKQGDPNVVNNHIPLAPITESNGSITKRALARDVQRGEHVSYVIETQKTNFLPIRIVDIMPKGFDYLPKNTRVNGQAFEPVVDGRRLVFSNLTPNSDGKIKIELALVASIYISPGEYVNRADLIDQQTDVVVDTARASVRVVVDPVFDCGDVIGKVFDDKNRNGYQDDGEKGLAGVRLATVKGVLITTDQSGLFHIACADLPNADIGSNFTLKLDTRTLPTGYTVTTENPRVVRLTAGKMSKFNFGAAQSRLINLKMNSTLFLDGTTQLTPLGQQAIEKLMQVLAKDRSVLRLTYIANDKTNPLAMERLEAVEQLIQQDWKKASGAYKLSVETRLINASEVKP